MKHQLNITNRVLITGGSGLVGKRLTRLLTDRGYHVIWLSRKEDKNAQPPRYHWDIDNDFIDPYALRQAHHIIHLAGAGVADERWTAARKKEIMDSRVRGTQLIAASLERYDLRPLTFISASAIGIYGTYAGDQLLNENAPAATDFLAEVTLQWEREVEKITPLRTGVRTVIIRVGIVLAREGGALPKMATPVKLFTGAPLGSGSQWMSWIHIDDLCQMFVAAIENERMTGVYNGVAPHPVDNKTMMKSIANTLGRSLLPFHVPAAGLKLAMGEMADMVLGGSRVSARKIMDTGFTFKFPDLNSALKDLLN